MKQQKPNPLMCGNDMAAQFIGLSIQYAGELIAEAVASLGRELELKVDPATIPEIKKIGVEEIKQRVSALRERIVGGGAG